MVGCEWLDVTCDADKRVIQIEIEGHDVGGSLELCYVPPEVRQLKISTLGKSKLTGTADLTKLPDGIQVLDLRNNQLTGELDITQLPESMLDLCLSGNQFSGEIDLTNLPVSLRRRSLGNNHFTGEIDLTHVPRQSFSNWGRDPTLGS